MNFWRSLSGTYEIEISSASISDSLTVINASQIHLFDVSYVDELTCKGRIYTFSYLRLKRLLDKRGEKIKITNREGLFWALRSLKSRPILLAGLATFLLLALYLPTRVLFVRVEGNTAVPSKLIIEKAEQCGIKFGTSRREIRSERVKNALLAALPQLQWTGVNTYGCVAIISVRERDIMQQKAPVYGAASIIAKTDGIITKMDVIRGTALCRVGQAVTQGQVLVSGYTDCGLSIKAEIADAEIYAQTRRYLNTITPCSYQKTTELQQVRRKFYLKIGKKLIKFSKDSGISSVRCVKMYKENYMLLPGGFQLPITLITEELTVRNLAPEATTFEYAFDWLKDYSKSYLTDQMLAGDILQSDFSGQLEKDKFTLTGNYACLEMIGQVRYEEIIDGNGKRN